MSATKWTVPVTITVSGYTTVEASSPQEAAAIAKIQDLHPDDLNDISVTIDVYANDVEKDLEI